MTTPLDELIAGLTELERELLLGKSKGWGSWMFAVGGNLAAKGLARKSNGSIYFDTPLAKQAIAALTATKADRDFERECFEHAAERIRKSRATTKIEKDAQ